MDYDRLKELYEKELVFIKDDKLAEVTKKIFERRSNELIDEETLRYNRNLSILLPMIVGAEDEEQLKKLK